MFNQFREKVKNASNVALIDSLVEHAQKIGYNDKDLRYYEAVKIIKEELKNRLEK